MPYITTAYRLTFTLHSKASAIRPRYRGDLRPRGRPGAGRALRRPGRRARPDPGPAPGPQRRTRAGPGATTSPEWTRSSSRRSTTGSDRGAAPPSRGDRSLDIRSPSAAAGATAPGRDGSRPPADGPRARAGLYRSAGAADALRGLDPPPASDLIKARDARFRVQSIRVLGEGNRVHVTPALAQLWQGGEPAIRRAIVEAALRMVPASLEPSPTGDGARWDEPDPPGRPRSSGTA